MSILNQQKTPVTNKRIMTLALAVLVGNLTFIGLLVLCHKLGG